MRNTSDRNADRLAEQIRTWLRPLHVRVLRMRIRGAGPLPFSISTLRGVWGRALRLIDPAAYFAVFEGGPAPHRHPLYIVRPDLHFQPDDPAELAFEWITWAEAEPHYASLLRAWDVAGGMGLGEHRVPFSVIERTPLHSDDDCPVSISEVPWPLNSGEPCRIWFPHSLRLMRHNPQLGRSTLLRKPAFADIVEAAFYRLSSFLAEPTKSPRDTWPPFAEAVVALSEMLDASPWQGEEIMLERYSGRQKTEVQQESVLGSLVLPQGAPSLEPLLTAVSILHLGVGTVMGLGRLFPLPLCL